MDFPEPLLAAVQVAFWMSAALVIYVYAGYPALLLMLSRAFGRTSVPPRDDGQLPFLSIIIAAHNEEEVIGLRVQNLLDLDYPQDRLEILIASDGSSDRTCEIVRSFSALRLQLLDYKQNRGKAAVLNDAFAAARGDVVLLSDANTMMHPLAARRLARWFADPHVGVVCGRLVLVDPQTGQNVDGMYWKYETFLKLREAQLGALLGANGAIYAIRRSLYHRLPARIAIDDFVIPLLARLRGGAPIVYEADAIAYEETPPAISSEFARRSRIGAGGFQSLSLLWSLMNPMNGWIALAFVSHKLLRWICPFFLVTTFASSAALAAEPIYGIACLAQSALYGLALAGYFSQGGGSMNRLARLTTMFAAMNLALLVGFFRWMSGRQGGVWQRTARPAA